MSMVIINIIEFTDYDAAAIHEFLLLQQETEFKIYIPRLPFEESDNLDLSVEFLLASYAGQLLGELSTNFSYFVPSPHKKDAFFFEVTIPDLEKFSATLHLIVQGCSYNPDKDRVDSFHDKASEFLNNGLDWDFECHTWGLYHIAVRLMEG